MIYCTTPFSDSRGRPGRSRPEAQRGGRPKPKGLLSTDRHNPRLMLDTCFPLSCFSKMYLLDRQINK